MNVKQFVEWVFQRGKLEPLGITDQHLHFAFGLISIALLYYILTPIIRWLTTLKWSKVMTFLVSSLFLLFLHTFIELYQGIKETGSMQFSDLASAILGIFLFGITLAMTHFIGSIMKQARQKNKSPVQQQKNA